MKIKRALVAVAAAATMAGPAPGAATEALAPEAFASEPMRIEGMAPWGAVTRVMEPDYPAAFLAAQTRAFVDISGRVSIIGVLADVIYSPGSQAARPMVEPLREVMRHWLFATPTDRECQPADVVVKSRVWFDFDGGQPKMSIARLRDPQERAEATMKAVERVEPLYPEAMIRRGWQANVFAKVAVNPTGDVVSVAPVAYPKQAGVDLSRFERAVKESLGEWKFTPAPELKRNREGCYTIVFRIRD